jgi:hypothetical protein
MAATFDITVRADRDFWLPVYLQTFRGNPLNMTGFTVVMTVKDSLGDTDAQAMYKSEPHPQHNLLGFGYCAFKITHEQCASWWKPDGSGPIADTIIYDVSCQDIATPPTWATLLEGSVTIIGPVTLDVGTP